MPLDEPGALGLLTEAQRTLRERVLPGLTGDARLAALMVASALGMAERELVMGEGARPDVHYGAGAGAAALVAALRAGRHDGDLDVHARLAQANRLRVGIAKPALLAPGAGPGRTDPEGRR